MEQTSTNLKNLLTAIDSINSEKYTFHIYIPSLARDVPFLQLNTAQQKTLIKSIIDSPIYNTEFIFAIQKIIKENCQDSSVNINELTIVDKLMICLCLRSKSIGEKYEVTFEDNGNQINHVINLDAIIQSLKQIEPIPDEIITQAGYEVTVGSPYISTEYLIERDIRSKNKNVLDPKTNDDLRDIIGEAFITELAKFVKIIKIINEQNEITVKAKDLTATELLDVLGRLPVKVLDKVLDYVNQHNEQLSKFTKVKIPTGINSQTKKPEFVEQEITVDGNFFIIS